LLLEAEKLRYLGRSLSILLRQIKPSPCRAPAPEKLQVLLEKITSSEPVGTRGETAHPFGLRLLFVDLIPPPHLDLSNRLAEIGSSLNVFEAKPWVRRPHLN